MLFGDYSDLVLKNYDDLKAANQLPRSLLHPSPARLKKECMLICESQHSRKDERVLRDFFGTGADKAATLDAIKHCDADKFRPLVNFINRVTTTPDPKIIELLAWMIDFQPRPFDYQSLQPDIKKEEVASPPITDTLSSKQPVRDAGPDPVDSSFASPDYIPIMPPGLTSTKKKGSISRLKKSLLALLLLLLISSTIYLSLKKNNQSGNRQCMYWSNDRYEPIDCSQKKEQVLLLALDTVKTKYFRRVTRPDTITYAAIGYLWYAKMSNDSIEFYTLPGVHPLDLQKKLRPITAYIIDKYVLKISPHP